MTAGGRLPLGGQPSIRLRRGDGGHLIGGRSLRWPHLVWTARPQLPDAPTSLEPTECRLRPPVQVSCRIHRPPESRPVGRPPRSLPPVAFALASLLGPVHHAAACRERRELVESVRLSGRVDGSCFVAGRLAGFPFGGAWSPPGTSGSLLESGSWRWGSFLSAGAVQAPRSPMCLDCHHSRRVVRVSHPLRCNGFGSFGGPDSAPNLPGTAQARNRRSPCPGRGVALQRFRAIAGGLPSMVNRRVAPADAESNVNRRLRLCYETPQQATGVTFRRVLDLLRGDGQGA